ncbi:Hypothetical Protein FCC1311_087692 [Hondaea fermentalgiana]|uniref:Uncharacterized protein n=1 Tax=Hondaea fermentalgiana TaxID=2315210 RepID=A0A2R5GPK0_9STRA|nr:Hypothetical Protein FCC1311_087692 [Hondaea fermentalgiana]|eukprot:GBG32545.1 Hypothetical Protein FCC1311_087692 [Hondaea fermentalgiana]
MVARRDDGRNDDDDDEEEEELAGEDDMLMLQDAIEDGASVAGDSAGFSKPRPSTSANRGTALKDMSPNKCHNLVMVLLVLFNTVLLMSLCGEIESADCATIDPGDCTPFNHKFVATFIGSPISATHRTCKEFFATNAFANRQGQ